MGSRDKLIGATIADRYSITGEIGVGGMGRIYSAISFADPSELVAIKVILRDGNLTYQDLVRFQREAAYMSQLFHPNIISFHEMGILSGDLSTSILQDGYYIVMELAYGRDLKSVISGQPQGLDVFLSISIQLASALEYMHSKGIVHQDIKPSNILLLESQQKSSIGWVVKILDFGISRFHDNSSSDQDAELRHSFAGTPLYMAPEVTGLVSGNVDHRADLYSLGCVMYQMLAGTPPFYAEDKDELVAAHAFKSPKSLAEKRPDLPAGIVAVIDKLLVKSPNDRYQSALGLLVDLQHIEQLYLQGNIQDISQICIGSSDHVKLNSGQVALVGRKTEFKSLQDSQDLLTTGRGRSRFTLIKGEPGTGKSRFVNEFKSYLYSTQVRCVFVRFSMHENSIPFNALANGFNSFLEDLAVSHPKAAEEVSRKISSVIGPAVRTLLPVFQALERFVDISSQADYQPMLPSQSSNEIDFHEFNKLFADLTSCLPIADKPLVVILDDMHLADNQTLQLLDQFFTSSNSHRIHFIITIRDLAIKNRNLTLTLEKLSKLRRRFSEINLGNLNRESTHALLRNLLSTKQVFSNDFISYVMKRTNGNPLMVAETVKALVIHRLMTYNLDEMEWSYDLSLIKRSAADLVSVDLTLLRIQSYDSLDRLVLEVAALLGNSFGFEMLLINTELQAINVMRAINRAISDSLILSSINSSQNPKFGKSFTFVHKRIREDICDAIDIEKKVLLHRQIALRLETLSSQPTAQILFRLAHHFMQSIDLREGDFSQSDQEFVEKAIRYNTQAGERAFKLDALLSAERYFNSALEMSLKIFGEKSDQTLLVMEHLADTFVRKKDYKVALRIYHNYLQVGQESKHFDCVSYKFANTLMLAGYTTAVMKQITKFCNAIDYKLSRNRYIPILGVGLRLCETLILRKYSFAFRCLNYSDVNNETSLPYNLTDSSSFHISYFFRLAQFVSMGRRKNEVIRFHWEYIKYLSIFRSKGVSKVYFVGDHAVWLAMFGFRKAALQLIDHAINKLSKMQRHSDLSYLSILKVLTINQFFGLKSNIDLQLPRQDLDLAHHYALLVHISVYEITSALFRGDRASVRNNMKQFSALVRTRHWLNPRGVAIYIFSLLLQGQRNSIIQYSEYLSRRQKLKARKSGLFVSMIESMISLVTGDAVKSKKDFKNFLYHYLVLRNEFLLPHEGDFASMFVSVFPELYYYEFNVALEKESDIQSAFLLTVRDRKHRLNRHRTVSKLVLGKIKDYLGQDGVDELYSQAISEASDQQQSLLGFLASFWQAQSHLRQGDRRQIEQIKALNIDAKAKNLLLFVDFSNRLLEAQSSITEVSNLGPRRFENSEVQSLGHTHSSMYDLYTHLVQGFFENEMNSSLAFDQTVRFLSSQLSFQCVDMLILSDHSDIDVDLLTTRKRGNFEREGIVNDMLIYQEVTTALLVPAAVTPNGRIDGNLSGNTQTGSFGQFSDEATALVASAPSTASVQLQNSLPVESDLVTQITGNESRLFDAFVPIRYGQASIGLICFRSLSIPSKDVAMISADLDKLGALIATWARYRQTKSQFEAYPQLSHNSELAQLESCPWLTLWTVVEESKKNQTKWILGLNINEDLYVLFHNSLLGSVRSRERVSLAFWYHSLVLRTLWLQDNKPQISSADLYESFKNIIRSLDESSLLHNLEFSFTVFCKSQNSIESGHFGQLRPVVMGVENRVSARNSIVRTLSNDQIIRFWGVSAAGASNGLYLLCRESSMFEKLSIGDLNKIELLNTNPKSRVKVFGNFLKGKLASSKVPRDYIAGFMHWQNDEKKHKDSA